MILVIMLDDSGPRLNWPNLGVGVLAIEFPQCLGGPGSGTGKFWVIGN